MSTSKTPKPEIFLCTAIMATFTSPSLGQLSNLPLELRYQIYECLNEDYCFQVLEPVSLFDSNRHDPCIPSGISRASKTIWYEVSELLHRQRPRILKIRICANGWRSNYHPSAFRDDWEAPDLSLFSQLDIAVLPPPLEDPAQALLIRRNIISFVDVLGNASALPPTNLFFGDDSAPWENQNFNRPALRKSHLPASPERLSSRMTLALPLALSFLHLRHAAAATISFPATLPRARHTALLARVTTSMTLRTPFGADMYALPPPTRFDDAGVPLDELLHTDADVLAARRIHDLVLDKLLDEMPGPTASRLRAERRRAWVAYGVWFGLRFARLEQTDVGRLFKTSAEGEYLWVEELGAMRDRGRRRCKEQRDEDWKAEKAWTVDGAPVGVSSAVCQCAECKAGARKVAGDRDGEGWDFPEHFSLLRVERSDFANVKNRSD